MEVTNHVGNPGDSHYPGCPHVSCPHCGAPAAGRQHPVPHYPYPYYPWLQPWGTITYPGTTTGSYRVTY